MQTNCLAGGYRRSSTTTMFNNALLQFKIKF